MVGYAIAFSPYNFWGIYFCDVPLLLAEDIPQQKSKGD